ncbi:MAG TPA: MFS transporter, partial [Myxococcota bacterium]
RMVEDRADLPNAIALNSSMVNGARLAGPAIAGLLIAAVGEGWCFLIDAFSYGAVLISVVLMRLVDVPRAPRTTRVLHEMAEGFRYVRSSAPIRALLLLLAISGIAGRPFAVLLPVIAREVMSGGAGTLGALQATAGVGALVGALYLASRRNIVGLARIVVLSAALFGAGLIAFSRAHNLALAMPLLLCAGAGMMVQTAASNTIIQSIVDEDKRGRVMSLLAMSLFGTVPLGSLIAGALATRIGADDTILIGGAICVLAAALFVRVLPTIASQSETGSAAASVAPPSRRRASLRSASGEAPDQPPSPPVASRTDCRNSSGDANSTVETHVAGSV